MSEKLKQTNFNFVRMKFLTNAIQTGSTPSTKDESYFDGDINWYTPGDFKDYIDLTKASKTITDKAIKDKESRLFEVNTIAIVGIGATLGKVALLKEKGSFNQQITGINTNCLLKSKFLYYWLSVNRDVIFKTANYTTLPIINNQFIKEFECPLPSVDLQSDIIFYLDQKLSDIKILIQKKESIIKLLEQQRQSIITEAVTKGLNPNVKMKDSGVEWIGEIPEHWEVKRLKNVLALNPSKNEVNALKGLGVTFLPMENILAPNEVDISLTKNIEEVYSGYTYFKNNDLVVAKVTPCFENGNIAVMQNLENSIGFGTTELHVLRAKPKQNINFYFYLAQSAPFKQEGVSTMYGVGGLKRIPSEFILNYKFAMPSVSEQNEIVEFLNEKCTELESIKKLINRQIDKLKEYRQALIYEAVTGKIDVRDMELDEVR
ncbi:restriction endonuclease subunit S [Bacillus pumilus]|nr:restriction endonuclease subunit S [Bacillus pumilus]